jgi:putative flippase GtrA
MTGRVSSIVTAAHNAQFLRFIAIGLLNTAFGYGVFVIGLFLGLAPAAALAVATVLGIGFNFFTTGRLVFLNRDNRRIYRFVLVYGVVYLGNVGLLKLAEALSVPPALAQLCILPVVVVTTFLLMRSFVFREEGT